MRKILPTLILLCALGCDDKNSNVVNDDGGSGVDDAGNDFSDADPNAPDAGPSAGCTPTGTQCNNCIDDDEDGTIDGFDAECTGLLDNDEGSFATGISGDNVDAKTQDCFFDGNSGGGDDKCAYHTCCLTDVNRDGTCPPALDSPNYEPDECTVTQACINNCAPLTPPGCDCFGCCTVCDDDSCRDIATNPAISPACTLETLDDPTKCLACVKSTECSGGECNPLECVLCPGQTIEDLPADCNETPTCPGDATACTQTSECLEGEYCAAGCCINQIG